MKKKPAVREKKNRKKWSDDKKKEPEDKKNKKFCGKKKKKPSDDEKARRRTRMTKPCLRSCCRCPGGWTRAPRRGATGALGEEDNGNEPAAARSTTRPASGAPTRLLVRCCRQ